MNEGQNPILHNNKRSPLLKPSVFMSITIFVLILSAIMCISNIWLIRQNKELKENLVVQQKQNEFKLLSPTIAWLGVEEFLKQQKTLTISMQDLKPSILTILNDINVFGKYGVYIEDLRTGAWTGINEKDKFLPASLLKLPVLVAVLRMVETGQIKLEDEIEILLEDINNQSGSLGNQMPGFKSSIKDLLNIMIKESDNTAYLTLVKRLIPPKFMHEASLALGLPPANQLDYLSPKEYANMLRGLYYSSYLSRQSSELALSIMTDTDFNSQIPSGIPKYIKVSHKVGFYESIGEFHDCGIVHLPNKPYIICVMSVNANVDEANKVISKISMETFTYFIEKLNQK